MEPWDIIFSISTGTGFLPSAVDLNTLPINHVVSPCKMTLGCRHPYDGDLTDVVSKCTYLTEEICPWDILEINKTSL